MEAAKHLVPALPRVPRWLKPTLAAWALAILARALLGCDAGAREPEPTDQRAEQTKAPEAERAPIGQPDEDAAPPSLVPGAPAAPADPHLITLSAVGDCTLGDNAGSEHAQGSFHAVFDSSGGDFARPFARVRDLLASDDLTIANLETTLTTAGHRKDTTFAFRGRPEFAKMLVEGSVELANMSNNHSADCGPRGIEETKASLEHENVGWFGLGHADVRIVKGVEVVNLGYTGGRLEVRSQVVKDVKARKRADNLVIVSFHWGIEGEHTATDVQQKLGRAAIDSGADLVIGHHPHVIQGIESYKGKKIVYSLGNFVFGGNARPQEFDAIIYRAQFSLKDGTVVALSDEVIPVSVSGNPKQNDFQPFILEGDEKARVLGAVGRFSELVPGKKPRTVARRP